MLDLKFIVFNNFYSFIRFNFIGVANLFNFYVKINMIIMNIVYFGNLSTDEKK
jgi:hypothetical protein